MVSESSKGGKERWQGEPSFNLWDVVSLDNLEAYRKERGSDDALKHGDCRRRE